MAPQLQKEILAADLVKIAVGRILLMILSFSWNVSTLVRVELDNQAQIAGLRLCSCQRMAHVGFL